MNGMVTEYDIPQNIRNEFNNLEYDLITKSGYWEIVIQPAIIPNVPLPPQDLLEIIKKCQFKDKRNRLFWPNIPITEREDFCQFRSSYNYIEAKTILGNNRECFIYYSSGQFIDFLSLMECVDNDCDILSVKNLIIVLTVIYRFMANLSKCDLYNTITIKIKLHKQKNKHLAFNHMCALPIIGKCMDDIIEIPLITESNITLKRSDELAIEQALIIMNKYYKIRNGWIKILKSNQQEFFDN